MNYNAYDEVNNINIYSGTSRSELVHELVAYILLSNNVDSDVISIEEIKSLNEESLKKIGIKLSNS